MFDAIKKLVDFDDPYVKGHLTPLRFDIILRKLERLPSGYFKVGPFTFYFTNEDGEILISRIKVSKPAELDLVLRLHAS